MKAHASAPQARAASEPREAVAHAELLSRAHDEGLKGIQTQLVVTSNEENGRLCNVKATVEVEKGRFEGVGYADPGDIEPFLVPNLIRVVEKRMPAAMAPVGRSTMSGQKAIRNERVNRFGSCQNR